MATKNNLQDILKKRASRNATPSSSNTPASSAKVNKFKPATTPSSMRNVPMLPTFSTSGFKKSAATTPLSRTSPSTDVSYVEKKSNSPGTKRSPLSATQPIKRARAQSPSKDKLYHVTPDSVTKSKGKAKATLPPSSPDDDKPWMNMPLDENFNPNPFSRIALKFPALVKPLPLSPKKTPKSIANNDGDSIASLQGKLQFNVRLQKDNSISIQQYHQSNDPCIDIATLNTISDILADRISALKGLIDAIPIDDPQPPSATVAISPYFSVPSTTNQGPSSGTQPRAHSPIIIDSDDALWDDMDDIPEFDDDDSVIEIIDDSPTSSALSLPPNALFESPYYKEILEKLRKVYRLENFRTNQLEAITAAMGGRDVFVLMPTGGGKSLCYQLPAVCKHGATKGVSIVVSPLLALMQNQVEGLKQKGVDVLLWNSETVDVANIMTRLRGFPKPDLLYVTPEKLKESSSLRGLLCDLYGEQHLARFVIDEAHCISTWGKDFRDAYKSLGSVRDDYPDVPIMALTATANQMMIDDIADKLKLRNCASFTQSFNRTNLNYQILPKRGSVLDDIVRYVQKTHFNKTGVIYCLAREKCEKVAAKLREKGLSAKHYHAKMDPLDKERILAEWQSGQTRIIVATIAFGMGIDKPDVRFVIHHDLPTSLDGYYQQTGRAGRDGLPADCVLYYQYRDFTTTTRFIEKNCKERNVARQDIDRQIHDVRLVMQYCENDTECRRVQLLQFFGEKFDSSLCRKRCNNCANRDVLVAQDVTLEAKAAINLVQSLQNQNVTQEHCRAIFQGKNVVGKGKFGNNTYAGAGTHLSKDVAEQLFNKLLYHDVFCEVSLQNGSGWHSMYLKLGPKANEFLQKKAFHLKSRPKVAKVVTEKPAPKRGKKKAA